MDMFIYNIQCPKCGCNFECDVETETKLNYYPARCPRCGNKTHITLAKTKRLGSLPKSKSSHYPDKKSIECVSEERITFKYVRQTPKAERKSRIIQPKQSKRRVVPPSAMPAPAPAPEEAPLAEERYEESYRATFECTAFSEPESKEVTKSPKVPKSGPGYPAPPKGRRRRREPVEEPMVMKPEQFGPMRARVRKKPGIQPYPAPKAEPKRKPVRFLNEPGRRLNFAIILLLIVFIFGLAHGVSSIYSGSPEQIESDLGVPDTVDIDGTVIDFYTGRPIPRCTVRLIDSGKEDMTNSDGYYLITNVKVGDQEIMAEAEGYGRIVKKVTVAAEQQANFNFELKPGVAVESYDESVQTVEKQDKSINLFAVFIIVFACFAILAIILLWQRTFFKICVFSAFISILSVGMGIGVVFGLLALILILLSSAGFAKKNKVSLSMIGLGKVLKEKGK